ATCSGGPLGGDGGGWIGVVDGSGWAFVDANSDGIYQDGAGGTTAEALYLDAPPVTLYYATNTLQPSVRASWFGFAQSVSGTGLTLMYRLDRLAQMFGDEPFDLVIDRQVYESVNSIRVPPTLTLVFEPAGDLAYALPLGNTSTAGQPCI